MDAVYAFCIFDKINCGFAIQNRKFTYLISMIKSKIRLLTHRLLMPRGRQYTHDVALEAGWRKNFLVSGEKNICVIQKSNQHHAQHAVILAHPYLADAKKFFLARGHAQMYLDHGFDVIIFDFNGFGESPFIDFDYSGDLAIVAEYLHASNPDLHITGHGISFGASHTINYATQQDNVFKKIIIENCLDSNLSYYKKRNKNLHFLMLGLMKVFPNVNRDHNYVKGINHLKNIQNVLFIYNTEDDLTTVEMGRKLSKACNIPFSFSTFSGQHLRAFQDNKDDYINSVISFIKS
jgi:uncharacterized protein